jgi:DNA-nicking Smr family endonuclease
LRKRAKNELSQEEIALFRAAVRGAAPLRAPSRVSSEGKLPLAVRPPPNVHDTSAARASGSLSGDLRLETGDSTSFLRNGLGRDVLRKLRRGHWIIQDWIDLHGLNRDEAADQLAEFIARSRKRGLRCIRVVHGKGLNSPGREPVLKEKAPQLLARRDEVLAFCQAPANQGGSGALLVLLRV